MMILRYTWPTVAEQDLDFTFHWVTDLHENLALLLVVMPFQPVKRVLKKIENDLLYFYRVNGNLGLRFRKL